MTNLTITLLTAFWAASAFGQDMGQYLQTAQPTSLHHAPDGSVTLPGSTWVSVKSLRAQREFEEQRWLNAQAAPHFDIFAGKSMTSSTRFFLSQRAYWFGSDLDIHRLGSAERLLVSEARFPLVLTQTLVLHAFDRKGERDVLATATKRVGLWPPNLGLVSSAAATLDLYDKEDRKIGVIAGHFLTLSRAHFTLYDAHRVPVADAVLGYDQTGFRITPHGAPDVELAKVIRRDAALELVVTPEAKDFLDHRTLFLFGAFVTRLL